MLGAAAIRVSHELPCAEVGPRIVTGAWLRADKAGVSPRFFTPALLLRKSDAELVGLVTAGHDTAFTAIVLRHRAQLLRHCRALLRDQRAEDVVQQTFIQALQSLRSGTEVRQLAPWLHRIARNIALNEAAAAKRVRTELNEEWEDRSRSDEYDRRATLREALLAVEALPDRQRAALVRSAAGEPPDAIARDLGITSAAARQLVHRARLTVRAAVRVISPPPLVWVARRAAVAWDKVPRAAGVPAGAAPVASKIAVAVIASATVAAPATVIHNILTSHPRPARPGHRVVAARTAPPTPRAIVAASGQAPSSPPVVSAAPAVHSAAQPSPHGSAPSGGGPGVSASSTASAPVGSGSSSADSSAGAPVAAGGPASGTAADSSATAGPVSTASASSPTATGTASTGSSATDTTSTDAPSSSPEAGGGSSGASGAGAATTSP